MNKMGTQKPPLFLTSGYQINQQPVGLSIVFFLLLYFQAATAQIEIVEQRKHEYSIEAIAWSPDGKRLISSDDSYYIKLWDIENALLLKTTEGSPTGINQLRYTPDGKYFVTVGYNTVEFWDPETIKISKTFTHHRGIIEDFDFHPTKKIIATCTSDTIKIWKYPEGVLLRTIVASVSSGLTISPNGRYLAAYNSTGKIIVWDIISGDLPVTLGEFTGFVAFNNHHFIQFSPDSKSVITKSACNSFLIFEGANFTSSIREVVWKEQECMKALAIHPKTNLAAVSGQDGQINIYNISSGTVFKTIDTKPIRLLAWSPDGKYLAGASKDERILIWNLNGELVNEFFPFEAEKWSMALLSPDGTSLVCQAPSQGNARIWNLKKGDMSRSPLLDPESVYSLAFSPDGKFALTSGKNKKICIWALPSWSPFFEHESQTNPVTALSWSPNAKYYASGDTKGIIQIFDAKTNKIIHRMDDKLRWMWNVIGFSWSPDGRELASGSGTGHYQVWDINTGILLKTFRGYDDERVGNCSNNGVVRYSPSGKYLAGPTLDCRSIVVWQAKSGKVDKVLDGISGETYSLAFSNDERFLFSGGMGNIRMWDLQTGVLVKKFSSYSRGFCSVVMSADNRWLIGVEMEGAIRIWDLRSGKNEYSLVVLKNSDNYILYKQEKPFSGSEFAIRYFIKTINQNKPVASPANLIAVSNNIPGVQLSSDK